MRPISLHSQPKSLRFCRWSRKGYAMFGSVHRQVTIGKVCKSIADMALKKAKALVSAGRRWKDASAGYGEKESAFWENRADVFSAMLPAFEVSVLWVEDMQGGQGACVCKRIEKQKASFNCIVEIILCHLVQPLFKTVGPDDIFLCQNVKLWLRNWKRK